MSSFMFYEFKIQLMIIPNRYQAFLNVLQLWELKFSHSLKLSFQSSNITALMEACKITIAYIVSSRDNIQIAPHPPTYRQYNVLQSALSVMSKVKKKHNLKVNSGFLTTLKNKFPLEYMKMGTIIYFKSGCRLLNFAT